MRKTILTLLAVFCCAITWGKTIPSTSSIPAFQPVKLQVDDTTRVSCEHADTAYGTWFNTLQLLIVLPAQQAGNTVTISPTPPTSYTFQGPCRDTLKLNFQVKNPGGTVLSNKTYLFVVTDAKAPTFTRSIPDSLVISCKQPVPDTSTVKVRDNCQLGQVIFNEVIEGSGNCPYKRKYIRTWRAFDACGNESRLRQVIIINDDEGPNFTSFPANRTIACTRSTSADSLGRPQISDNCDDNPRLSFSDTKVFAPGSNCRHTYELRRLWTATDVCGNSRAQLQTIQVVDNQLPSFTPPKDTIIDCEFGENPQFSGSPTNLSDNCTQIGPNNLTYTDVLVSGNCDNNYSVQRTWRLADSCGNVRTHLQRIQVRDIKRPVISRESSDLTLTCQTGLDAQTAFNDWLNSRGGALASDNCTTPASALQWVLQDANTGAAVTFPTLTCRQRPGILMERRVRFIVVDECNNRDTSIATFRVIDNQKPRISNCPRDTTLAAEASTCSANFQLRPPSVEETCSLVGTSIVWSYRINDAAPVNVPVFAPIVVNLPAGNNRIQYIVRDCGNNADTCTFRVNIQDRIPPEITCPPDVQLTLAPGACTVPYTLPRPAAASDNCRILGSYRRTLPLDSAGAYLTYSFNAALNAYIANGKTYRFDGIASNATSQARVIINYQGDFNSPNAFLEVFGENGLFLGASNVGGADCGTPGQFFVDIRQDSFNRWAADGQLNLRIAPRRISTPSGQPGEGVNPCNPAAITADGQTDKQGWIYAELSYRSVVPTYYATGATPLPLASFPIPPDSLRVNFNPGETKVFYIIKDEAGNADTCSYKITIRDTELPVARCQATTLFINPSGVEPQVIEASAIDAGSTDNCSIASLTLSPNTFTCAQIGTTQNLTLTVTDRAGNVARCSTLVRLDALAPRPSSRSGRCGNDTLFLFANPPVANGGMVFTYRWTGPNGFVSTNQNPVIPRVGSRNAGSYSVEITGITGCKSLGIVEISIEDLPVTPALQVKENVCVNEAMVLTSTVSPPGNGIVYRWYRGNAPSGTLLGQSNVPSFSVNPPHTEGQASFYLTIESNGCVSQASAPRQVSFIAKPQAIPRAASYSLCEGSSLALGTDVSGTGTAYQWTGPNGFNSTSQNPPVIASATMANAGVYSLVIARFGCASDQALIPVNVVPKPARPEITYSGPTCEGGKVTLRTNAQSTRFTWVSPSLEEFKTTTGSFDLNNVGAAQRGNWRVYLSNQDCNSELSAAVNVVINEVPKPRASASPNNVCEGSKLELRVSPLIANATYQWRGPEGYTAVGSTASIDRALQTNAGVYQIRVTTPEGCVGLDSVRVEVIKSLRIVEINSDAPKCLSGPTDIKLTAAVFPADDGSYRYNWTGPNGFSSNARQAVIPNGTQASSGNYKLVVSTPNGCASEEKTLALSVADGPRTPSTPRLSDNTPQPICETTALSLCTDPYQGNNLVYNWVTPKSGIVTTTTPCLNLSALQAADAGNYAVFVSIDGCNSLRSGEVAIQVNSKPKIEASTGGPACQGAPIELRATFIAGATYAWSGPSFTSSLANPVITEADSLRHAGLYSVIATLNGCRSETATTRVEILPSPKRPSLRANTPFCIGGTEPILRLSLNAGSSTPGATYAWSGPNGVIGSGTTTDFDITEFTGLDNGNYPFTVRAQLGTCISTASDPFVVQMNRVPSDKAFAGPDFSPCQNQTINLVGQAPSIGVGFWTQIAGDTTGVRIISPGLASTPVRGLKGDSTYTFRWTLSNGICRDYSTDNIVIKVNKPDTAFAGDDILACFSREIKLKAQAAPQGRWVQSEVQSLLGVLILDPSSPESGVTGMQPGNLYSFIWTVPAGGCGNAIDEVFVIVSDPGPFAGRDQNICNNEALTQLQADKPSEGSKGRWKSLTSGVSIVNPADHATQVRNLRGGANTFVWEVDEGVCGVDSRDTVVINFKKSPKAVKDSVSGRFGAPIPINVLLNDTVPANTRVTLVQQPFNGRLSVTGSGLFTFQPNVNFIGQDKFVYQLCSDGCECSVAEVKVQVGQDADCEIPNVITPNGDQVNDLFTIPCLLDLNKFPQSQVIIFNRWGDEVFRSARPYRNTWNGTYNGQDLPPDTYYYLVDYGQGKGPSSGFIVIQR